jgi:hypothetical protein
MHHLEELTPSVIMEPPDCTIIHNARSAIGMRHNEPSDIKTVAFDNVGSFSMGQLDD